MKNLGTRHRRAISPVIATVILVAVTISISVAVAYWMGGIAGTYTRSEQVQIQSAVCTPGTNGWTVSLSLKNTGSGAATLTNVFINNAEVTDYSASAPTVGVIATNMTTSNVLASGQAKTILIYIGNNYQSLSSGTTVNIDIHSAGGMDYIKLVQLV